MRPESRSRRNLQMENIYQNRLDFVKCGETAFRTSRSFSNRQGVGIQKERDMDDSSGIDGQRNV